MGRDLHAVGAAVPRSARLDGSPHEPGELASTEANRPPRETLLAALDAAAEVDHPLFTLHAGREPSPLGARALREGAWRWARALLRAGAAPGDRVPILLPTSAAFLEALVGTMMAGAVPVPLASPLTFGPLDRYLAHLSAVLADAEARVLVTTTRVRDAFVAASGGTTLEAVVRPEDLPGSARAGSVGPSRSVDGSTPAFIQYTSGTTGRPKGVVVSQRGLTANAFAIARRLDLGDDDVGVSWLPLFHDMGLVGVVLTAICHPFRVHLMRPDAFAMRPDRWLGRIAEEGATLSAAPNFAYERCVARSARVAGSLASWRIALNGAEPVLAGTVQRFEARFGPAGYRPEAMTPAYGLAEATLAVSLPDPGQRVGLLRADRDALAEGGRVRESDGEDAVALVSVGHPVAGTSVRIRRDGRPVAEGEVGEIETRGPCLMDGYFRNAAATERCLVDGWLRTGDLGAVHGGALYVVGRAKEVIIKGGHNIHPHDVETVAGRVAGVSGAVAAFGQPNPATGTDDLVVVAESRASAREGLERAIRGEVLAALGVKVDAVALWPLGTIPRTTSGKLRRGACRTLFGQGGPR